MSLLTDSHPDTDELILCPTDMSEAGEAAFHHALAIGIRSGSQFTLLHALGRRDTDSWPGFPSTRETLGRWRAAGSTEGLEQTLAQCMVTKLETRTPDPVAASVDYVRRHKVDLIVMAVEGRSGLARLIRAPRAEALARESLLPTLFVPHGCKPFVDGDSGAVTMRRMLLPVDAATDAKPAMVRALQMAVLLSDPSMEITLLHVGDDEDPGPGTVPNLPFCQWRTATRTGDVATEIQAAAQELEADAICMSTAWTKAGLGRAEHGVTEHVLATAPCPVFTVPAGPG